MSGELKSYQSQVNAYRFEIERIDKSIGDVKRQYFDRRRRELRNIPADGEIIEEEDESDLRGDPEDPDNHDAARYDGRMLQDNYYQNRDRSDAGQLPEADEDAPDHAALSEPIEQPADDDALAAPVDDAQEVPPEAVADEDAEPADNDNAAEPEGEDNQPNDE
uniref:Uncharacterized protein n=1 Tax=Euplotes harpa TaxID=151035 RepID=A0A7S3NCV5_9SPIT|mmetsp:Transcript_37440/g.43016  ORF Transcript_37440/g.43016 Transcript_37440/m.43016 type:complete len:163 (+) Transcript_37440:186-674(+)